MGIKRMLMVLSMAMAVGAFSAPAVAQANVILTDPPGTKVPVGAGITATSTNFHMPTSIGTFTCKKVTLHYTLVTNGNNHVVLNPVNTPTHNGTTEGCEEHTVFGSFASTATNFGTGQLTINTWGTGVTPFTYTTTVPALNLHCTWTGNLHVRGTNGTDIAHAGPSSVVGSGPNCPASGTVTGTFTLETSNGTPVTIDHVNTP